MKLEQRTNVNVKNVKFSKKTKRSNVYNVSRSNQAKARHLVEKFEREGYMDAENCYFFFVKCFSKLSEDTIWSIFEKSTTTPGIRSKIKYFIGACRNQMTA